MVVEGPAKLVHKKRAKADKVYLILFNDSLAVTDKKEKQKKGHGFQLHVQSLVDLTRLAAFHAAEKTLGEKEKDKEYCHALTIIFNTQDLSGPQEGRHEYRLFFKNTTEDWVKHLESVLGTTSLSLSLSDRKSTRLNSSHT